MTYAEFLQLVDTYRISHPRLSYLDALTRVLFTVRRPLYQQFDAEWLASMPRSVVEAQIEEVHTRLAAAWTVASSSQE